MARGPQESSVSHDCGTTHPNPTFPGFLVFLLSNLCKYFVAGAARHGRDVQREQAFDVPSRRSFCFRCAAVCPRTLRRCCPFRVPCFCRERHRSARNLIPKIAFRWRPQQKQSARNGRTTVFSFWHRRGCASRRIPMTCPIRGAHTTERTRKRMPVAVRRPCGAPWQETEYTASQRATKTYNAGTGSALGDDCARKLNIKRLALFVL